MSPEPAATNRVIVLAALDPSEAAHEVLRAAANFARGIPGAELHLAHVVEDMPPPVVLVPPPLGLGVTSTEVLASARERMKDLAAEAGGQFTGRLKTHLVAGVAWKQILRIAADLKADFIVLGTHGRGGVKRLVLGSVAEMVVRKASCPVLVVREKDYRATVPSEADSGDGTEHAKAAR